MRTVRSGQINHFKADEITELKNKYDTLSASVHKLTDRVEHFLDLGQEEDKPPDRH